MAKVRSASAPAARTTTRCAIYTRKSTEEGLDQEFNSLDAQREACAAYVLVSVMKAGSCFPIPMMMGDTQVALWIAPDFASCW